MGILNAQDRDLIYNLAENKEFKQLAHLTMKIIRNNNDQWGLYILEVITFIIKRIVRKGHEHINQYQIELNKLQYLPENDNSNNQLWITQTYQLLRLLRVNNKFIRPQTQHTLNPTINSDEFENLPAPSPYITLNQQNQLSKKEPTPLNIISQPFFPKKQTLFKPPNKIEKKIIYQDDDDSDWSDQNPFYYNDESYSDDSIEQTLQGSEHHLEKHDLPLHLGNKEYYKDLLNLSYDQQITKAQIQDRLDKRKACISIWTQSINSELFYTIREFVNYLTVFSPLNKDTAKTVFDKNDAQLKLHIQTNAGGIDLTPETMKMIRLFALIIMKNTEANEKSCIFIHFEAEEFINRVYLRLKCLQKHAYFIKSDIIQLLTTKLKKQIALKEINFSIRIQALDNRLRFKEFGDKIQILNSKKSSSKRKNNRPKRKQTNNRKKRRNNKRGRR